MMDYSRLSCCVVDNGLFVSLAEVLARSFGRVWYYSPWETPFPKSNARLIGYGLPNVQRVNSIWPILDEVDLFVFPDIGHGPLQVYLDKIGKRVWGGRLGENFETLRGMSKRWMRDVGLEVGSFKQIRGIDRLRTHLQQNDDKFVKISETRGDMETFHAQDYRLIEPFLDDLEHGLGAAKQLADFIVEDPIEPAIEVGYDGFTIDGRYPGHALYGVEVKDKAYLGQVVAYRDLPGPVLDVNRRLAPLFQSWRYRGFFSSEIRVKGGVPYLIDPCCRMASPPGELYQHMIENLADVLWHGADGSTIEPRFTGSWGAELIMRSNWDGNNWHGVDFPPSVRQQVKLHYQARISGREYFVPQQMEMAEIGAVVASGDSPEDAIKAVTKVAEKVKGYGISFDFAALERAQGDMEKLKHAA